EGAVIILERVVIIVPEVLEAFLFGRHALGAVGEDVPPRRVAAVTETANARAGHAATQGQTQGSANDQGIPFHRDSFTRLPPRPLARSGWAIQVPPGLPGTPSPGTCARTSTTRCGPNLDSSSASGRFRIG